MIGGQPSVVIQASALKGMVRSEFSAEKFRCFLKTKDKYSQGARVIRNVIATFVFKGVEKQAKETDNSLK